MNTVDEDEQVEPKGPPMGVSRRRLLKSALAIAPSLVGAQLLAQGALSFAKGTGSDADANPALKYDPAAHDWAFVCDTNKCIGCGHCVVGCKVENHVPLNPEENRTWIERHVVATDGKVYIDSPEAGINGFPPESEAPGAPTDKKDISAAFFMPRLCMQCENPPCVSVCPVTATFQTADGVILVDQDRCIGCGYCVVACPYGARYLVPAGGPTPTGITGVVDKCTWCYHRITKGMQPACVEMCPVGARVFGDRNDPQSTVNKAIKANPTKVLRPSLGTKPRVYYVGLEREEVK